MLLFDITPERPATECHDSLPDQGNIRLKLLFDKSLPDPVTCLIHLEYDNSFRIDKLSTVSVDFY